MARALHKAGARKFFVAAAEEGAQVRQALGPNPEICIFSGHCAGDTDMLSDLHLTPMINSPRQLKRHLDAMPGRPFGIQLDTGMNRLGMELTEWASIAETALNAKPMLVMSHLACADEPDHPMNAQQLTQFQLMTDGIDVPRSLAATGGILLGSDYHFDMCRPGVGLYGGFPFEQAAPVVQLDIPIIQTRDVSAGESVGYSNTWIAPRDSKIATLSAGYADGLLRSLSDNVTLWSGSSPCPLRGRVSMDLLTVDVTDLDEVPSHLSLLTPDQGVDDLAEIAGTIGYEILTSMGARYRRRYGPIGPAE